MTEINYNLRYRCPQCARKGVTTRFGSQGEDYYACRYCDWWAFTQGQSDAEARHQLVLANFDWAERGLPALTVVGA
jgi:DNA-directed RNA polymerase subunit RPC12/RpoP